MRKKGLALLGLCCLSSFAAGVGTMNAKTAYAADIAADASKWATIAAKAGENGLVADPGPSYVRLTQGIPVGSDFEYTFKSAESAPDGKLDSWVFIALSDIPEIDTNTHTKDSVQEGNFVLKLTWCNTQGFNVLNYITAGAENKAGNLAAGDLASYMDGQEHVQKFRTEFVEGGWSLIYSIDGVDQLVRTFEDGNLTEGEKLYFSIRVSGGSAGYALSDMTVKAPPVSVDLEKDFAASAANWSATAGQLSVSDSKLTVGPGPYGVRLNKKLDKTRTFGFDFKIPEVLESSWTSLYLGSKHASDGATTAVAPVTDDDFYIQLQFNKQWNVFKILFVDKDNTEGIEVKNVFNDVNDVFTGVSHHLEYKTEQLDGNEWKFTVSVDGVALAEKTLNNGALAAADGLYFSMSLGGTGVNFEFSKMGQPKKEESEVLPDSRYEGNDLAAELTNWAQAGCTVEGEKLTVKSAALAKLNVGAAMGGELGFAFRSINGDAGVNNNWNFLIFGNKSYGNSGSEQYPSARGDYNFIVTLHDGFYKVDYRYFDTELRVETLTTVSAATYNWCDGKAHVLYLTTEKDGEGYRFTLNIDGKDEAEKVVPKGFADRSGSVYFTAYTSSGGSASGLQLFNCGMKEPPLSAFPTFGTSETISTAEANWIRDAYKDDITFGEASITFNSYGAQVQGANNNAGLSLSEKISKQSKINFKFQSSVAGQNGTLQIIFADMKNPMDGRALKYWESLFEHVALQVDKNGVWLWNYNDAETGKQIQLPVANATANYMDGAEHSLEILMAGSPDGLRLKITIDQTVHADTFIVSNQFNRKSCFTIGMGCNDAVTDSFTVSDLKIAQIETTDDDVPGSFDPEDVSGFTPAEENNLLKTENWQSDPFYDEGMVHDSENGTLEFKVFGDGGNHQCYAYKDLIKAGSDITLKFSMNVFDPYGSLRVVFMDLNGKTDGQSVTPWNPLREVYTLEVSPTGMLSLISFKINATGTAIEQKTVGSAVKTNFADGNIHILKISLVPVYGEDGAANGVKVVCYGDGGEQIFERTIEDPRYIAKNVFTVAGYSSNITHNTESVIKLYYLGAERVIALEGEASEAKTAAEKVVADIYDLEQSIGIDNFESVKAAYNAVKAAYDALDEEWQGKVYNHGYLVYVGNKIERAEADLAPVIAFIGLVEAMPEITETNVAECKTKYEAVIAEYKKLTEAQKAYITDEASSKLNSYKGNIEKMEQTVADKAAANEVIKAIDALDKTVTKENYATLKSAAEAAEARFNALTYNQKAYVTNYKQLKTILKAVEDFDVNGGASAGSDDGKGCGSIVSSAGAAIGLGTVALAAFGRKKRTARKNREKR